MSKKPKEKMGATLSHKALPLCIFQVLCITLLTSAVLTQPQGGQTPRYMTIPILQRSKLRPRQICEKGWHGAELDLPKLD